MKAKDFPPPGTKEFVDTLGLTLAAFYKDLEERFGQEKIREHLSLIGISNYEKGHALFSMGEMTQTIKGIGSWVRYMASTFPGAPRSDFELAERMGQLTHAILMAAYKADTFNIEWDNSRLAP